MPKAKTSKKIKASDAQTATKKPPSKAALLKGSNVIVEIEGREFILPKKLVCYYSRFFDRAFNGRFMEGKEQKVVLGECTEKTFRLIVQWLRTSKIVSTKSFIAGLAKDAAAERSDHEINEDTDSVVDSIDLLEHARPLSKAELVELEGLRSSEETVDSPTITILLEFFKLADRLDIAGPFDSVITMIEKLLIKDRECLTTSHIQTAAELPPGNDAMKLFAKSYVMPYVFHIQSQVYEDESRYGYIFCFTDEIHSCDAFALELFRAFHELCGGRKQSRKLGDPLTGYIVTSPK